MKKDQIHASGEAKLLQKRIDAIKLRERRKGYTPCRASDQAVSPPEVYDKVHDLTGLNKHNMFDITQYDPHFDSQTKFNAKIRQFSPE